MVASSLKRSDSRRTFEEAMGVQAALFQQPFGANPYRRPTERWSLWRAGWSSIMHSKEWATVSEHNGEYIKCDHCRSEFYVPPHQLSFRKYCSPECRVAGGWRTPK